MSPNKDSLLSEIKSNDIDISKVTEESLQHMKCKFPHKDTDTLARYLIARDNKVSRASKLLELSERWRTKHWPILKSDCIDEIQKGKVYLHGYDKEGRPLIVFRSKLHDITDRNAEEMAKMVRSFEQISLLTPTSKIRAGTVVRRACRLEVAARSKQIHGAHRPNRRWEAA